MPKPPYVFFGSPEFSVEILELLGNHNLLPELIITSQPRRKGRGKNLSPSPVGQFGAVNNIEVLTPEKISTEFIKKLAEKAPTGGWPVFLVVAYGKILPAELIYFPQKNTLNLHPSLLPRQRGAAPIRGSILEESSAGVTIIELDEQMDHGPIVAQQKLETPEWPVRYDKITPQIIKTGAELLANTLPAWVGGDITATAQKHDRATYSRKFQSSDGEINLEADPVKNFRKICAFTDWPKAHFFTNKGTRVLITKAHLENGELVIDRVKPAGSDEMSWREFEKIT